MQQTSVVFVLSCVCVGAAKYELSNSYSGWNLFDGFDFSTNDDPTHGYVDFIGEDEALSLGLINVTASNQAYIGTDTSAVIPDDARGRKSIRMESKIKYDGNNLFVIDLEHMPSTKGYLKDGCASWPAFWSCGPSWPSNGEIDIIEYVNTDSIDTTTLHTSDNCDQSTEDPSTFTGIWGVGAYGNPSDNCYVNAEDQWANQGCGIVGTGSAAARRVTGRGGGRSLSGEGEGEGKKEAYAQNGEGDSRIVKVGSAFNNLEKGGVYVLEWLQDRYIRAFYFERDQIPTDLYNKTPDPDSWSKPYARFELGDFCSSDHFHSHSLIFDNTFCGDWAGATFGDECSTTVSCNDYVKYNPSFFEESYWLVNFVDVYSLAT